MPFVQTTYSERQRPGFVGMIVDAEPKLTISRIIESAAGIGFGVPAFQGSADHGIVGPGAVTLAGAGAAVAGNTGAATITASPAVAGTAKVGVYRLTAVSAGATADFLMSDPDGIELGNVTTGTPATIGGIGPFTITDAGADPAVGDQFTITVTAAGASSGLFRGITIADITLVQQTLAATDRYQQYGNAGLLVKGVIWVTAGATVTVGQPVYAVPATGVFTNVAAGNIAIPNAIFESSAASAALVKVRLN